MSNPLFEAMAEGQTFLDEAMQSLGDTKLNLYPRSGSLIRASTA